MVVRGPSPPPLVPRVFGGWSSGDVGGAQTKPVRCRSVCVFFRHLHTVPLCHPPRRRVRHVQSGTKTQKVTRAPSGPGHLPALRQKRPLVRRLGCLPVVVLLLAWRAQHARAPLLPALHSGGDWVFRPSCATTALPQTFSHEVRPGNVQPSRQERLARHPCNLAAKRTGVHMREQ